MLQDSTQQAIEGELSVSIVDQIRETHDHAHADDNFDVESLLVVVRNILNGDTLVEDDSLGTAEAQLKEKAHEASFIPPLIKQLSIEIASKDSGVEIPCKTTMSVLKRLSSYSWNAKAVLTLAAFALDYGEFWLLNQFNPSDKLGKSVRVLQGVPTILKLENKWIPKQIAELDKLIKATLEVIECIFKLEKLFKDGDAKDVPALSTHMGDIPIYVYRSITTIVACSTQLFGLINDEDKTHKLSPFIKKINDTLDFLKMHIELYNNHMNYLELVKVMRNQRDIVVAFKELRFGTLIDGPANKKEATDQPKNIRDPREPNITRLIKPPNSRYNQLVYNLKLRIKPELTKATYK
ncbi:protein sieve element occlusion b [Fagus crenata]